MQQTEKYQFNLIESSDAFSAQPLNDNMVKLEEALTAHQAEVSVAPRIITGTYTGTGKYGPDNPTVLEFPDAERPPVLILISEPSNEFHAMMIRGTENCLTFWETYRKCFVHLTWTDKGVSWYNDDNTSFQLNYPKTVYSYMAFF